MNKKEYVGSVIVSLIRSVVLVLLVAGRASAGGINVDGVAMPNTVKVPNPPPTVASITPNSALNTGSIGITNLAGTGFLANATVKLAQPVPPGTSPIQPDINATNVVVVSAAQITCAFDLAGQAPGPRDVVVTNSDKLFGVLPHGFNVNAPPPPTVASITPNSGINTGPVNITDLEGTGFRAGATVKLAQPPSPLASAMLPDIIATNVVVVSPTQITCSFDLTGQAPGPRDVMVTNSDKLFGVLPHGFNVNLPPPGADVLFSQPVPGLTANQSYQSCMIGNQGPTGEQHWKLRLRDTGTFKVDLTIAASAVNPIETGALRASVTDETGLKTVDINYPANGDTNATLTLNLVGGKIYDLTLKVIGPISNPPTPVGHHYKLGSKDGRLELGWEDPLQYLEGGQQYNWSVNAGASENVSVDLFTDMPSPGAPMLPQATFIKASVTKPDGTVLIPSTSYAPPANLSLTNYPGGAVVIHIEGADAHFRMRKNSGSDKGIYVMPCGGEILPPAPAPKIMDIKPDAAMNVGPVDVMIEGEGFLLGATVKLAKSGETDIVATNLHAAPNRIGCTFDLKSKTLGKWDVVVTNPDKQSDTLSGGFEIVKSGDISHDAALTSLTVTPNLVNAGQSVTFAYTVKNLGTVTERNLGFKLSYNRGAVVPPIRLAPLAAGQEVSGNFSLTIPKNIKAGDYLLTGEVTGVPGVNGDNKQTVTLTVTENTSATYSIAGVVQTAKGQGIAGVQILIAGTEKVATTDKDGTYQIDGLAVGTYTVTPYKKHYLFDPTNRKVTVGPNQTDVNFTGSKNTEETGFSVSGFVKDASGNGIPGVKVSTGLKPGKSARDGIGNTAFGVTDETGAYQINGLDAATYTVTPDKQHYTFDPTSRDVTVGPDQKDVNFVGAKTSSSGHDLALTSLTADPNPVSRGQTVTISFKVKNLGEFSETKVTFKLSYNNGLVAPPKSLGTLASGQEVTGSISIAVPRNFKTGDYLLTGEVVPIPKETNTDNNKQTLKLTVK